MSSKEPVAILISGLVRSFREHLYTFLDKLPEHYHIFLSFARFNSSDHFLNKDLQLDYLLRNPNVKLIFIDSDIPDESKSEISEREQNIYIQWYRLQKLFKLVPSQYTRIFRCRPDIQFECSMDTFMNEVDRSYEPNVVYVPKGFDTITEASLNDQIAYGDYESMKTYCNLYSHIDRSCPLVSEKILNVYLHNEEIQVKRTDLPYKLVLSQCMTIAICGDSGAGKSSLSKLIQEILPFDQTLLFETDRYHKWERGAEEYKTITHLNPAANHLEKLSTDAFKLCVGEDVYAVDYDHSTGKFTDPQQIKPNKFMVFCGLHTLYKESLNQIFNLKIYLDTDPQLKQHWKIQRDVVERGADPEALLATIRKREPDYLTYIKPQEAQADIIIRLYSSSVSNIRVDFLIKSCFAQELSPKLLPFLQELPSDSEYADKVLYKCKDTISKEELTSQFDQYGIKSLKENYEGLIQYVLLSLLWR